MFKKRRGIHLSYNEQGLIYFICMNVSVMPADIQKKILNLCIEIGGEHYQALYEFLTNDRKSASGISLEYFISETQLYGYRKKFYEKW